MILASAARMIAQAAVACGFIPLVIDLYGDKDTQQYALAHAKVASLSIEDISGPVENFIHHHNVRYAVYGSGLESFPETLEYLTGKLTVFGNTPGTFNLCQSKDFFSILKRLDISYPETVYVPPEARNKIWLEKAWQRQGGYGVKFYDGRSVAGVHEVFWQHYINGSSHSVLFLSNGRSTKIIGFNTQWSENADSAGKTFFFSGIINDLACADHIKPKLEDYVLSLAKELNLTGVNSLDFMLFKDQIFVTEINARPPYSAQLYSLPWFQLHIKSCLGELPDELPKQTDKAGGRIIYAQKDISIPENFDWPPECFDIPQPKALIRTGQPICSIIARAKTQSQVVHKLQILQHVIVNQLQQK